MPSGHGPHIVHEPRAIRGRQAALAAQLAHHDPPAARRRAGAGAPALALTPPARPDARGTPQQAADIEIQAKEILFIRALLCEYIADYTGQPVEKIEEDCDRDFFMTPEEAKDYGIIDEVLASKVRIPNPQRPELLIA